MFPQFRGTQQAPSIVTSFFPRSEEWRYLNEKLPQIANARSEDNEYDKNSKDRENATVANYLSFWWEIFAIFDALIELHKMFHI